MASRPKFWPRPRPPTYGLSPASISLSYYVIGHFSGKNRVKFRDFCYFFPAIIFNRMLSIIIWYISWLFLASALASTSRNWPRPRPRPGSSGFGLEVLASFNITIFYHMFYVLHEISWKLIDRSQLFKYWRGCETEGEGWRASNWPVDKYSSSWDPGSSPLHPHTSVEHMAHWSNFAPAPAPHIYELDDFSSQQMTILRTAGRELLLLHGWTNVIYRIHIFSQQFIMQKYLMGEFLTRNIIWRINSKQTTLRQGSECNAAGFHVQWKSL